MKTRASFALIAAVSAFSLAACGGSSSNGQTIGGGGGAGDGSGAVTYTGLITEATISNSNKTDLTASAYQGGTTGGSIGSATSQTSDGGQTGQTRHLAFSQTLKDAVRKVDFHSAARNAASKAISIDVSTVYGDCPNPGSATVTLSVNDVTGAFSGNISFSAYCTQGNTISGSMDVAGLVDLDTWDLPQFDMTFDSLTSSSSCGDSITNTGGINANIIGSTATEVINMLVKDNVTSEVFWLDDFTMVSTAYDSYMDVDITGGRFYHPNFGYVTASSPTPLRFLSGNDWPSTGVVLYTGKAGMMSLPTKAKLTVVNSSQYRIEADLNGDSVFEYNSGNLTWDTGFCSY